jgi:hypothetical protein
MRQLIIACVRVNSARMQAQGLSFIDVPWVFRFYSANDHLPDHLLHFSLFIVLRDNNVIENN